MERVDRTLRREKSFATIVSNNGLRNYRILTFPYRQELQSRPHLCHTKFAQVTSPTMTVYSEIL